MDIALISTIIGIFAGLGALFAGVGFAYAQFKSGANKAKDDLVDTLKETVSIEKDRADRLEKEKTTLVGSHQSQINDLNNKLGKLQGLYEASEKSKQEYLQILQGRDPAQHKFMEFLTEAAVSNDKVNKISEEYMVSSIAILGEIKTFMENINTNSRGLQEFTATTTIKKSRSSKKKPAVVA